MSAEEHDVEKSKATNEPAPEVGPNADLNSQQKDPV
jgi:hypothetical protein